ncbi:MAG: amidase [Acidimicrobiaceae bacterium]|nr:amidase [Acidimicrobiaceae bacterium]MBO0746893.1 amidase [Acidimicrobiaceae bacterium]
MELPLTIAEASAALEAGTVTSTELTAACLKRIAATQESLGAFVTLFEDAALEAAALADVRRSAGADVHPLTGVPLAIKDIIATKEARTTANSKVLPAGFDGGTDAPVVSRLRAVGSVILGKSTTSEYACGMPDPETGYLVPHNPWDVERTPAGSSAGTGIAVAARLALGGLGTDTGGSVRAPAAANGHTGLKVTFGRVPKNGVVPLGYSLDSVGPMAASAYDCATLLAVIAGHDAGDPCASTAEVPRYTDALTGEIEGLRIGIPVPYFYDSSELDEEARTAVLGAVEVLREAGAQVTETEVPFAKEANDANILTMVAEAFSYHRNHLISRWSDYGRHTRRTLARGALTTSGDYAQAQRFRARFCRDVGTLLTRFDVLVTPGSLGPADRVEDIDPERRMTWPSFYGAWNFAGLPAVVGPCGAASVGGLPLAMQIVGRPFAEDTVLRVLDAYQRRTDWHRRVPPVGALMGTA